MNRLVLIGNGFDLAHGLKTSYADFINWYWDRRMHLFANTYSSESKDDLCSFNVKFGEERRELWSTIAFSHNYFNSAFGKVYIGKDIISSIIADKDNFETTFSPLFERIIKGLESKTWGGIEQDYYDLLKVYAFRDPNVIPAEPPIKALNQQLRYIQELLVEYLMEVSETQPEKIRSIEEAIYAPLKEEDISVAEKNHFKEHKSYWEFHEERNNELYAIVRKYGYNEIQCEGDIRCWREDQPNGTTVYPFEFLLPKEIMLLNFNYTNTASQYRKTRDSFEEVHIHGEIGNPPSVIFGYGDELDDNFKELKAHKNNACLSHVKSIRYMEAPNYRQMLSFIESEPFQVLIMGHSCGNSDRTLLNTIFEHPNCVSIKPYYYVTNKEKGTDNYIELVQHISRNFNDMKLMRDRVVNKTQCEPLVKE